MYLHPESQQDQDGGEPEATGTLLLDLQKSNLGKADQQIRLAWNDHAKLFTAVGGGSGDHWIDRNAKASLAKDVFLRLLDKAEAEGRPVSPKSRAGNFAPKAFAKRPGREGLTKRDFEQAMEQLFDDCAIEVETYKDAARHTFEKIVRCDSAT
jgi:hypothetical protein